MKAKQGINLIFLKEGYINTEVYRKAFDQAEKKSKTYIKEQKQV